MYTVSQLIIYPIKSLGGVRVNQIMVTDRGLEYDRRWMLVDNLNRFLTQRKHPEMALFSIEMQEHHMLVSHKVKKESIKIPLTTSNPETALATVWNDQCLVRYISDEVDRWFSKMLLQECRLVYMPDQSKRMVDEPFGDQQNITSFSDGFPVLIIGQSSLDNLNSRLKQPVPMDRFRPNIVFTGGAPHIEDSFTDFNINGAAFKGVKASSRCNMITIDQQTGKANAEPLTVLATYRKQQNNVYFGQNLLIVKTGKIAVGEQVIL